MATLSSLDFWVPLLALLFVAVAYFGGFKARALLVSIALTVAVTDGIVCASLKKIVNRPRPHQTLEGARVVTFDKKIRPQTLAVFYPLKIKESKPASPDEEISGRSFPSGHTANNFAVAMVLTLFYRRRGWLFFFVAAAVGYSRIYTAAHWPSDVFVSVFLGTGIGFLTTLTLSACWRRWGCAVAPGLFTRHPSLLGTSLPS